MKHIPNEMFVSSLSLIIPRLKKSINSLIKKNRHRQKLITFYVGCLFLADKDILGEKYGYLKIAIIILA